MSSSSNHVGWNNGDLRYIPRKCKCGKKASVRIVVSNKPSKEKLYFVCDECEFWAWCLPSTTNSSGTLTDTNEHNEGMGTTVVRGTTCKCLCEKNNLHMRMMLVESHVKIIMIIGVVFLLLSFMLMFFSSMK